MTRPQEEQKTRPRLLLEVISADKTVLSQKVDRVVLPGAEGDLTVLPDHFPLISHLNIGIVEYYDEDEVIYCFVNGGVAQVGADKVIVVTPSAEIDTEIDLSRAQAALERARKKLKSPANEKQAFWARSATRRADVRLEVKSLLKQKQEENT